ncbi:hypothetical protein, partial [Undibacterium sp. CCC1.1]|uniref:hypothetical protein n=1 Tax=Undibacterium sp. CCC1.1 TaxID=3048602 RepID=UPI002B238F81
PPKACGNDEAAACGNDEAAACGNDEVGGVSDVKKLPSGFCDSLFRPGFQTLVRFLMKKMTMQSDFLISH